MLLLLLSDMRWFVNQELSAVNRLMIFLYFLRDEEENWEAKQISITFEKLTSKLWKINLKKSSDVWVIDTLSID